MKLLKTILCAAAFAAFAVPATVQARPKAQEPHVYKRAKAKASKKHKRKTRVARKAAPKRVKTYDFTGDKLEGDLLQPDGDQAVVRVSPTHTSLLRLRKDFVREIGKAAEDL